ncbi:MAG: hypothetical protein KDK12_20285 [Rhodobacteraceae bacterium]|nr:hypothetical protein [Paracoccaceae bacterium]
MLGSRPEAVSPDRHIRAPLIRLIAIGGSRGCGLPGTGLWLEGAWITEALDLRHATAKGEIVLHFCTLVDEPRFDYTTLTVLSLDDSAFPGLFAQGAEVKDTLFFRRVKATGTVNVNGARIGGHLTCEGATLDGAGDKALTAQGLDLGQSLFLRGVTATGTVDVNSARIGGQLACEGATLDGAGGKALNAQGLDLGQDMFLDDVTATGTVDVNGARIGGQLSCEGATLNGAGKRALNGQRMRVGHGFFFRAVKGVTGDVYLPSASVGDLVDDAQAWAGIKGQVQLDGFTYERISAAAPTDAKTRLDWLAKCANYRGTTYPQPYTQLAKVLAAMGHGRAARLVLHKRGQVMAMQERAEALEQLARLRKDAGQDAEDRPQSERVVAQRARASIGRLRIRMAGTRAWTLFLDRLIGYGYRPEFAAGWALGTLALATLVYGFAYANGGMAPNSAVVMISASWAEAMAQSPGAPALTWVAMPEGQHYETFAALPYALDVVLPIVDLGQQSAWAPTTQTILGTIAWAAIWFFTLFGWMLSALLVAALTGLIQKNQPGADQ